MFHPRGSPLTRDRNRAISYQHLYLVHVGREKQRFLQGEILNYNRITASAFLRCGVCNFQECCKGHERTPLEAMIPEILSRSRSELGLEKLSLHKCRTDLLSQQRVHVVHVGSCTCCR